MLDAQQIFDKVAAHLLAQGKRAAVLAKQDDGMMVDACVYRNQDGLMCAVGCRAVGRSG